MLYSNLDLLRKRFNSLPDEELHFHVMSEFESKTYCRIRIKNILLKNVLKHLYNSYHI